MILIIIFNQIQHLLEIANLLFSFLLSLDLFMEFSGHYLLEKSINLQTFVKKLKIYSIPE
jgi:hypothetical protein